MSSRKSCPKGKHYRKSYRSSSGKLVKPGCVTNVYQRKKSRMSSKKASSRKSMVSVRRRSRKLSPALKKMSSIVKRLSRETGLYGPKLMKEAGKIYRKGGY